MSQPDLVLSMRAADFAARRHTAQRRKGVSGEPYLNHLVEVAALIATATNGGDPNLVAAALLHDALEDTDATYEELETRFGGDVAALVSEVTDDKSLPKAERKLRQIETASSKSERARILKIADKISNVRALAASPPANWDLARMAEYVDWAEKVVAGCRGLNAGLEHLFDAAVVEARAAIADHNSRGEGR